MCKKERNKIFKVVTIAFFLWLILMIMGCNCTQEREAHKIMANRHFTALKKYYTNDTALDPLLKESISTIYKQWEDCIQKEIDKIKEILEEDN